MASSYAHAMERQALLPARLDGPAGLDNLQAKKNFSVSHLLDLEEAGDMVAAQADEGSGEPGRSLLESPGLTSGSDTPQQDSKCGDTPSAIPPRVEGTLRPLHVRCAAGEAAAAATGAGPWASSPFSPSRSGEPAFPQPSAEPAPGGVRKRLFSSSCLPGKAERRAARCHRTALIGSSTPLLRLPSGDSEENCLGSLGGQDRAERLSPLFHPLLWGLSTGLGWTGRGAAGGKVALPLSACPSGPSELGLAPWCAGHREAARGSGW